MSKGRKFGILLIIVGAFVPSVLYPFATLTTDATLMKIVLAAKGGLYKPRLNDLEIVLRKPENPYSKVGKEENPYVSEKNPFLKENKRDQNIVTFLGELPKEKVAVPYNYTVALGITIAFVGISFVALSHKKKDIK